MVKPWADRLIDNEVKGATVAMLAEINELRAELAAERDALAALLDKSLYALEYASDMTKPEGLSGCDCPICTVIGEIEAMKEAK